MENKPLPLYYDHKVIINISRNLVICGRTKHVGIDRYFKKEKLIDGQLFIPFVKSEQQLVDVLTKGPSYKVSHSTVCEISMRDVHTPS